MQSVVAAALQRWGMDGAAYRLAAQRENTVYRVDHDARAAALRLHRVGYRSDAELRSELAWMDALANAGLAVPAPVMAADGAALVHIGGVQVDMLEWCAGETLDICFDAMPPKRRVELFASLGNQMARMHTASDAWDAPPGFMRPAWDKDGLVGAAPLWDRFWENPLLNPEDRARLLRFRDMAAVRLADTAQDYGLIHADLVPGNVMVDGAALIFIDFDDGGWGYRLFDIATTLLKHSAAPDFSDLQTALLAGYRTVRPIDTKDLPLFMALRAVTYVGWNIARRSEPGGAARNGRFIDVARRQVERYLDA